MAFRARHFYIFLVFAAVLASLSYLYLLIPLNTPVTVPHLSFKPPGNGNFAYATFLGPPTSARSSERPVLANATDSLKDNYFSSARLLNYQIKHAEKTKTRLQGISFLVLVLPHVPKAWTAVLEAEGATVVGIEPLELPDAFDKDFVENSRFRDVLAKLRLWQLVDYEKILYLDADSFLLDNLDELFTNPVLSAMQTTLPEQEMGREKDLEGGKIMRPPGKYLMAASTDTYGDQTVWETSPADHPAYLCACFMLFAPSNALFNYYLYILNGPEAPQNAAYPEQDLLIWVHRKVEDGGRMPWRRIPIQWSANDGEMNDELALQGGVKSLHVKGWEGAEGGNVAGEKYKEIWTGLVREMEEYWENVRISVGA